VKALSIRQPWAWAILHAGKRVENRDWKHPPTYRGPLLIHAAKGCTMDEYENAIYGMENHALIRIDETSKGAAFVPLVPRLADLRRGGIVGRASLIDVVRTFDTGHRRRAAHGGGSERTCLLCGSVADVYGHLPTPCPKPDPWAIPWQLGFVLANVEPLPFVPFKGALGFFDVDEAVLS